jgi:hypothetical protein
MTKPCLLTRAIDIDKQIFIQGCAREFKPAAPYCFNPACYVPWGSAPAEEEKPVDTPSQTDVTD